GRLARDLDDREHRADRNGLSCLDEDLRKHAGAGRRDLHRDLVRLDVQKDLVGLDAVADLLVPAGDGSLGDGLTELRHQYVHRVLPLRVRILVVRLADLPAEVRRTEAAAGAPIPAAGDINPRAP